MFDPTLAKLRSPDSFLWALASGDDAVSHTKGARQQGTVV